MARSREVGRKQKSEKNKAKKALKKARREEHERHRKLKKKLQREKMLMNQAALPGQNSMKKPVTDSATTPQLEQGQGDCGPSTSSQGDDCGDDKESDKVKDVRNMEHRSLAEGGVRVKYSSHWKGTVESLEFDPQTLQRYHSLCKEMADVMWELETAGFTPVLPDGRVGGNLAARFTHQNMEFILVSKSGKIAGHRMNEMTGFCLVESFDTTSWEAGYRSVSEENQPTSDTPLHYAILNAHKKFGWSEVPGVVLHGHALETEAAAAKFGFPISLKETLFSTPEDTDAMMVLLNEHPYPENQIFIRKNHGFMLLGKDLQEAVDVFRKCIKERQDCKSA